MAFLTDEDRKYTTPEDIIAHVGDEYAKFLGAIVPPIFQDSLFVRPDGANGIPDDNPFSYTRINNPTTDIAERKVAALEGADGALCFSSGMGAISSAIMHYIKDHCHVVIVDTSYGPSLQFIRSYLHDRFHVEYTLVHGADPEDIKNAVKENTTLIYLESPSSVVFRMQDLDVITAFAREKGIGTVIDGTYATPIHQQPLKHGVDIVCHTASKYLGGHSDIVAGVVAARREIIESIQYNERALLGNNMDPHQSWLMIRGMRTLIVRLNQHAANAAKVVEYLENSKKVKQVFYPGSKTYAQNDLYHKYMTGGNGLLTFVPNCPPEEVKSFVARLHMFQYGVSWGGFESLCIPAGCIPEAEAPKGLVRMHVGLENVDTLIADIDQALAPLPDLG